MTFKTNKQRNTRRRTKPNQNKEEKTQYRQQYEDYRQYPFTYSTLVNLWVEYSMFFSPLHVIIIVDQLQEPREYSELPRTEKHALFYPQEEIDPSLQKIEDCWKK